MTNLLKDLYIFTRWDISNNQRTFWLVQEFTHPVETNAYMENTIQKIQIKCCIIKDTRMSCWWEKTFPYIA